MPKTLHDALKEWYNEFQEVDMAKEWEESKRIFLRKELIREEREAMISLLRFINSTLVCFRAYEKD